MDIVGAREGKLAKNAELVELLVLDRDQEDNGWLRFTTTGLTDGGVE